MEKHDSPLVAALADLQTVIVAIHAALVETQRVYKEAFGFGSFAHRADYAVEAFHRDFSGDFGSAPALALIILVFQNLKFQARRMGEPDELLPEPLLDAAVCHLALI